MANPNRGRTYYARVIAKDPCVFCGNRGVTTKDSRNPRKMTLEHIHPKSAGGSNHWMNIAPSCSKCNARKSNLSLLGYLLTRRLPKSERRQFVLTASFSSVEGWEDVWELPENWHHPVTDLLVTDSTK